VNDQLSPVFRDALLGQTIGSRVAVTAPSSEVFGDAGNAQMDIGNEDSVLLILDLMKMFEPPKPKDVAASRLPGVVEEKGEPTALDFKGLPRPRADGDLLRAVLKTGKGKPVTTDMTLEVNYLGMVYNAKAPFDESYSSGQPLNSSLGGLIQGWSIGLTGVKVGSRVRLADLRERGVVPAHLGQRGLGFGHPSAAEVLPRLLDDPGLEGEPEVGEVNE
jgi:peptidylprolyl isomerase